MIPEVKTAFAAASVSTGSAATSFFVATLPIVQWSAAAVAVISGVVAIVVGGIKILEWWRNKAK